MPSKVCLTCENEFSVVPSRKDEAKFCSRECYHSGQRQGSTSHNDRRVEYVTLNCTGCGEEIEKSPSRANRSERQFCSQDCYLEWSASYQRSQEGKRARYREAKETSCEICGFDRYVEVCHIVPASEGGTYEKDNILFLCANHHKLFDRNKLTIEECNKLGLSDE